MAEDPVDRIERQLRQIERNPTGRSAPDNGRLFIGDREVQRGETVKDFRGDDLIVKDWYLPGQAARGARILCSFPDAESHHFSQLFFTGVINARIVTADGQEFES